MKNKTKQTKEKLDLGAKINDIDISLHHQKAMLITFLVLANLLLVVSLIVLIVLINTWYVWLIAVLALAGCCVYSVFTYLKGRYSHNYTLYENYLVIKSMMFDANIETRKIVDVKIKRTFFDRLFRLKTFSIVVYYQAFIINKVTLFFVKEDASVVVREIMDAAIKKRDELQGIMQDDDED